MGNNKKNNKLIPFEYPKSFLENIVVNSPVGIIMTDYDYNVIYMNAVALEIHRLEKITSYDNLNLKDIVMDPEKLIEVKKALISENKTHSLITYEIKDNKSVRVIRTKVNLARDENYFPIGGFFYICEDVTEIKKLREESHENEKLETLKEMIVTYNHEMNNAIAVIMGRIELIIRKLPENDENLKNLKEILNSTKRLSDIVRKIREIKKISVKNYDENTKMIDIDNN